VAVEVRDLAVPPFKGQFVGDVGYASGKHRQMTLRHNTVSRVEPRELRPAPGSFLNPIERVTYRPSPTPSFAQPIDANRHFDGPSLQPESRRSGGLTLAIAFGAIGPAPISDASARAGCGRGLSFIPIAAQPAPAGGGAILFGATILRLESRPRAADPGSMPGLPGAAEINNCALVIFSFEGNTL
jgi:hypothetical protein